MVHKSGSRRAGDKSPTHPQKQGFCAPNSLFFRLRPNLFWPAGNLDLIALDRAFDGLLGCPFQFFEQSGNMGTVVCHTKLPLNHLAYSWASPYRSTKPICFCTVSKKIRNQPFFCIGEFRWSSCMRTSLQALFSFFFYSLEPTAHCAFADI